jgi:dTDP-4-dehydrorhamnose 3,5-epimerase-like enzyme
MAKLIYKSIPICHDELTEIVALNIFKKPIKRVFWIYNNSTESVRGNHRHHKTNHLLVCLSGSCKVYVNNGKTENVFQLNNPNQILHLEPIDWREMYDFSEDCILSCFCDELYDPSDYIYTPYHNKSVKKLNFSELEAQFV